VLIDTWASTDFIILYPLAQKYRISLVFMHLMLSTYRKQHSPPLFTPFLPNEKEVIQQTWKQLAWQKKKHNFKQAIRYLGHHDSKKIKQKFKENLLPDKHQILWEENPYNYAFAGVPELVFSAEELEFAPLEKRPHQQYLGGIIYTNRKQVDIDPRYESVLSQIIKKKQPLMYCAFGTLQKKFVGRIILFLQKLFFVFQQNPHWQLICTASREVRDAFQKIPLGKNIHFLSKVPQLELLPKVDVFITHGGLNSIQEALHFGIPTLNYPLNLDCDHVGNAARIFYHRLGLRGEISQDSPKEIAEKINELLTNPLYKQNLQAFKEKTEVKYTEERVLALFEGLIKESALI
jgi:UDP:flavonoid glycosyltransferase YjiC (YdhE family)